MSREVIIEKEKIVNSIERLREIELLVNRRDLSSSFAEIETLFRDINFIHANCLNYKESINSIYDNISYIKSKISYLLETLNETLNSVNNVEEVTADDLMKLSAIYDETSAGNSLLNLSKKMSYIDYIKAKIIGSKEITKIPAPTQPVEEDPGINTVPIGIAIGATGVLGSIGAVAVNEIYGSESKKKNRTKEVLLEDYDDDDYSDGFSSKRILPANTPYHAAREERESERFYGNELQDFPYISDDDK